MIIQTVRLVEVYYVESVHLTFARVRHSEVEPLRQLPARAVIKLAFQIILKVRNLVRFLQVSRFESRLEKQCWILG